MKEQDKYKMGIYAVNYEHTHVIDSYGNKRTKSLCAILSARDKKEAIEMVTYIYDEKDGGYLTETEIKGANYLGLPATNKQTVFSLRATRSFDYEEYKEGRKEREEARLKRSREIEAEKEFYENY